MNTRFRAHQIVRLIEFTSTKLQITLSATAVACAFEVGHSVVKRAHVWGYDNHLARGRPHELATDAEQQPVDWITVTVANNVAVNRTELLHKCNERFGKSITKGWVDSFLTRHANQLFETKKFHKRIQDLKFLESFSKRGLMDFEIMFIRLALDFRSTLTRLESANGKTVAHYE
jgi:hypothetical protein